MSLHPKQLPEGVKHHDRGEVMAYWVQGRREWRNFFHWKKQYRKQAGFIFVVALLLVAAGTLLVKWLIKTDGLTSFYIGLLLGIVYGIFKFTIVSATIKAAMVRTKDIIITSTGVSLNGKFNSFAGDSKSIQQVTIIEEANPKILHISYHNSTSKGITTSEIYIPIPKGKLGEAVNVMRLLEKAG